MALEAGKRAVVVTARACYVQGRFSLAPFRPPMPDQSSLSVGQALGRWILHVLVFIFAGGVAAGLSALAYESIAQAENPVGLYGVIFAAGGLIAYRLSERVVDASA